MSDGRLKRRDIISLHKQVHDVRENEVKSLQQRDIYSKNTNVHKVILEQLEEKQILV